MYHSQYRLRNHFATSSEVIKCTKLSIHSSYISLDLSDCTAAKPSICQDVFCSFSFIVIFDFWIRKYFKDAFSDCCKSPPSETIDIRTELLVYWKTSSRVSFFQIMVPSAWQFCLRTSSLVLFSTFLMPVCNFFLFIDCKTLQLFRSVYRLQKLCIVAYSIPMLESYQKNVQPLKPYQLIDVSEDQNRKGQYHIHTVVVTIFLHIHHEFLFHVVLFFVPWSGFHVKTFARFLPMYRYVLCCPRIYCISVRAKPRTKEISCTFSLLVKWLYK